jgi:NAD(P)-dependent dehydrogenase (short-subunit alcohol dehydrogenase family)
MQTDASGHADDSTALDSSKAMPLRGRVVVVTGAGGNLGSATARAFARAGARLALVGRDVESLRAPAADLATATGVEVEPFAADLADANATMALAGDIVTRFGAIDAVAHTAGAFRGGQPVTETSAETLDAMLRANLLGPFCVARAMLPPMIASGRGSLTFIAARAGLQGRPGLAAYCAAKSGVIRLVESLAAETAGTGVRVNCLLPDAIAPPGGGAGTPAEAIADVLVALAADSARAITGAAIPV